MRDARFNLRLRLIISRLKPTGPVRDSVITFIAGANFTIRLPSADPRIAPIIMNAKKYTVFDLSKTMFHYRRPENNGYTECQDIYRENIC